jgi:hypothetical protein
MFLNKIREKEENGGENGVWDEDGMRKRERGRMLGDVRARNEGLVANIIGNLDCSMIGVPMIVKAVFRFERPEGEDDMSVFT